MLSATMWQNTSCNNAKRKLAIVKYSIILQSYDAYFIPNIVNCQYHAKLYWKQGHLL